MAAENLHIVTSDLNHTGSGGPLTDTDDLSITVAAVNDNPNLQPDTTTPVSYTENAGPTTLFSAESINSPLADPDQSANFLGGSLTVGVTSGFVAGDEIALIGPFGVSSFHIVGSNLEIRATTLSVRFPATAARR